MNGNEPSIALFERAVPRHPLFNRQLADPAVSTLLRNACEDLNYDLL